MVDASLLGAHELRAAFGARTLAPPEIVEALADAAAERSRSLNALTATCFDRAMAEANESERRYAEGTARSLEGIPFVAKDLFDTVGVETNYGSPLFAGHVPEHDAEAVKRARAAGAILLAKTSTDEFAYGITSNNPHFGPVLNPWAPDRVSGGSSGGSAVAVATGLAPLALGSDTGGSIRVPAAFCGVVGLKPSYGRVSNRGLFPMARTLDHSGPLARNPADARLLLEAIAVRPVRAAQPRRLRVGVCRDLHLVPLADEIAATFEYALTALEQSGAELVELKYPSAARIFPTFLATQRAETAFSHRRRHLYPDHRDGYGDDVRARLDEAATVTLHEYLAAQAERKRLCSAFERLFERVTVLLTPLQARTPPTIDSDDVEETTRLLVMDHTVPQNLFGNPACAVRAGFDRAGVPVGVQIVGPLGADGTVLAAAELLFEATADVQARQPPVETMP
jgi:aspartyl-tRNA(Asn)/glutamyl-tRNA(Gln) amidotransferase subunit A